MSAPPNCKLIGRWRIVEADNDDGSIEIEAAPVDEGADAPRPSAHSPREPKDARPPTLRARTQSPLLQSLFLSQFAADILPVRTPLLEDMADEIVLVQALHVMMIAPSVVSLRRE